MTGRTDPYKDIIPDEVRFWVDAEFSTARAHTMKCVHRALMKGKATPAKWRGNLINLLLDRDTGMVLVEPHDPDLPTATLPYERLRDIVLRR